MQTSVVIDGRANVETISGMGCPGGSCGGIIVNQGLSTKRGKRHLVETEWAIDLGWLI
jgi:hypothetical protein